MKNLEIQFTISFSTNLDPSIVSFDGIKIAFTTYVLNAPKTLSSNHTLKQKWCETRPDTRHKMRLVRV